MDRTYLIRAGGFAGLVFSVIWVVCGVGYVIVAGIPSAPAPVADTVALLRRDAYQLLFWLWPVAYLAAVPFSLGARQYLQARSPLWADLGSAFLLLYVGVWFVFHATVMVSIGIAGSDPVDEALLGFSLAVTGSVVAPLFFFIALFEGAWALAYLKSPDPGRSLGWVLLIGAALSLVYFAMRLTGPIFAAELIHEGLILCMVVGVAGISRDMLASGP